MGYGVKRIESIRAPRRAIIRRYHKTGYLKKPSAAARLMKLFGWTLFLLMLLTMPWTCQAAEPWYYLDQSDYRFMVPDKMQHFYGSYLLTEQIDWPAATLLGILWECKDAAAGSEFSINDLVADGLGIASALLNNKAEIHGKSPGRFAAALDWRQSQNELIFFVKMKL